MNDVGFVEFDSIKVSFDANLLDITYTSVFSSNDIVDDGESTCLIKQ